MARTTTRRPHRAAGTKTARRPRKTPLRSTTPQRKRTPSRNSFQHRPDLIGASLIALGVFLGFVEYMGWDGGVVGAKIDGALHLAAGRVAAAVPMLLVIAGASVFLRSRLLHVRPLRTGVACSCSAPCSPSRPPTRHRGGSRRSRRRLSPLDPAGADRTRRRHDLVVLCMIAAVILITGGSIGLAMRSSGQRVPAPPGRARACPRRSCACTASDPCRAPRCARCPRRRPPRRARRSTVRPPSPTSSRRSRPRNPPRICRCPSPSRRPPPWSPSRSSCPSGRSCRSSPRSPRRTTSPPRWAYPWWPTASRTSCPHPRSCRRARPPAPRSITLPSPGSWSRRSPTSGSTPAWWEWSTARA